MASTCQCVAYMLMPLFVGHLATYWHYTYAIHASVLVSVLTLVYVSTGCKYVDARLASILPVVGAPSL